MGPCNSNPPHKIFTTNFYYQYPIPNFHKLKEFVDQYDPEYSDDTNFEWGKTCNLHRRSVKWEDCIDLIKPTLEKFSDDIGPFKYEMYDPWINFYKKGYFQDVHDHCENDFVAVFLLNYGKDFSELYFYDRNSTSLNPLMKKQLNYCNIHYAYMIMGEVVIFPGHMMHGVTPHNSDTTRKTLAVNFNLVPR